MPIWRINFCSRVLRSNEGLTLETSASESLYGGQFTLSTQLIKPNYLVILPPTQHHSFFRNLPPLFVSQKTNKSISVYRRKQRFISLTCSKDVFLCQALNTRLNPKDIPWIQRITALVLSDQTDMFLLLWISPHSSSCYPPVPFQ